MTADILTKKPREVNEVFWIPGSVCGFFSKGGSSETHAVSLGALLAHQIFLVWLAPYAC
jgi:hypothetical protein